MRRLLIGLLLLIGFQGLSQTNYIDTVMVLNGFNKNVAIYRFPGYTSARKYPILYVFFGAGENNTPASAMRTYGPFNKINSGTHMIFTNDSTGVPDSLLVVGAQLSFVGDDPSMVDDLINKTTAILNADTTRRHMFGWSNGGQVAEKYNAYIPVYARRIAAMVNFQGEQLTNQGTMGTVAAANGLRWFGIEGSADFRNMAYTRDTMNAVVPGSAIYELISSGSMSTHTGAGWNLASDTSTHFTATGNKNVYKWLLSKRQVTKLPPVADAGVDTTIVLPTNSAIIKGSGSQFGGSIVGYLWSQTAGPNTPTLSGTTTTTLSIGVTGTAMIAGQYTFQLRVQDADGGFAYDSRVISVSNGVSNVRIAIDNSQLFDRNGRKDKSILWLFDNDTLTRIDRDGIGDQYALPFSSWVVLPNVYQHMRIDHFDAFTSGGGGLNINVYDSSVNFLGTYRMNATGGWTTLDISAYSNIRFIEVQTNDYQDVIAGIWEFRLYGDVVAPAAPIYHVEPIVPFTDPGVNALGMNTIDDRLFSRDNFTNALLFPLITGSVRVYYEGIRFDDTANYRYTRPLTDAKVNLGRFGYDHINTRVFDFTKANGMEAQICHIGANIKQLDSLTAMSSNGTYNTTTNDYKYMERGADSTLFASWAGYGSLYASLARLYGTNTSAGTGGKQVINGVATAGQGGMTRVEIGNEYSKDFGGVRAHYSPIVYYRLLKTVYDSVKAVDPNMPVYAAATTYMDTCYDKGMAFEHFLQNKRTKFPANGFCKNIYLNNTMDGQGGGSGNFAISAERWHLKDRGTAYKAMMKRLFPNCPTIWTETGVATFAGSPYDAPPIGGRSSELVAMDMELRNIAIGQSDSIFSGAVYYAFFGDGTGNFNSMAATKKLGAPDYLDSLYEIGYGLITQKAMETGYNFFSTTIVNGDSTGVWLTMKPNRTTTTKKLFKVWRGTSNGSTGVVNIPLGGTPVLATITSVNLTGYVPVKTPVTITGNSVNITAREDMQWLEVTYLTEVVPKYIKRPGVRNAFRLGTP